MEETPSHAHSRGMCALLECCSTVGRFAGSYRAKMCCSSSDSATPTSWSRGVQLLGWTDVQRAEDKAAGIDKSSLFIKIGGAVLLADALLFACVLPLKSCILAPKNGRPVLLSVVSNTCCLSHHVSLQTSCYSCLHNGVKLNIFRLRMRGEKSLRLPADGSSGRQRRTVPHHHRRCAKGATGATPARWRDLVDGRRTMQWA